MNQEKRKYSKTTDKSQQAYIDKRKRNNDSVRKTRLKIKAKQQDLENKVVFFDK